MPAWELGMPEIEGKGLVETCPEEQSCTGCTGIAKQPPNMDY